MSDHGRGRDGRAVAPVRPRFWVEASLGGATAALAGLTLLSTEWVEVVFGVDPDRGSGTLEWLIVAALLLATLAFGLLAGREAYRPTAAA
jgi:hypothetical protein